MRFRTSWFHDFATGCARFAGRPAMLLIAVALSLIGFGAFFSGSDHLLGGASLAISTITLLLLPILQATQNRDGAALHAKIDELIKAHDHARNALIGIEEGTDVEIERIRQDEQKTAQLESGEPQ
ncbi:low affinity iron permease family protein [Bosea sp. NBC_00550]|uniref:low affinity iron permease family protein n=1 Tax=Bosea sp. NBC_00550 TaxID=2969621 RepID=UPI00222FEC49|nr:low affinity iron permease family protein [Bosea sp. NBC_00550]UZF95619.1 low affinity iron permease family protein [Bosea sp. NBC_00550]